jgi:valyl-tRNA synthetase
MRLVKGFPVDESIDPEDIDILAGQWLNEKMNAIVKDVHADFKSYRLSEALISIYSFVWDDFCSWYLEMIKPNHGEAMSKAVYNQTKEIFLNICSLLHPYMPFITEEIWSQLNEQVNHDCILSKYPQEIAAHNDILDAVEHAKKMITQVRETKAKNGIKAIERLPLFARKSDGTNMYIEIPGLKELCIKMANLSSFELIENDGVKGVSFITDAEKYFVEMEVKIDVDKELEEKQKELQHQIGFVTGIEKKLSNEKFVEGAPAEVIERERKKLADGKERIKILEDMINNLKL